MTEPRPCYHVPIIRRELDPELLNDLAQARRMRLVLMDVIEWVYDELVKDQDLMAIPLGLAIEQYKHPFSLVAHDHLP